MTFVESQKTSSRAARLFVVVGAVLLAFAIRQILALLLHLEIPRFATFYPAILLGAWCEAFVGGSIATALAAALALISFDQTGRHLTPITPSRALSLGLFACVSLLISFLTDRYRRATRDVARLERYHILHQVEVALSESEERFRLAASAAHAMVYDLDMRAPRVIARHGLHALLGYDSGGEVETFDWWYRQIHPEDLARCFAEFERTQHDGTGHTMQYRVRRRDGCELWVEDHATAIRYTNGDLVRIVGTVVDITDRKQAEDSLRSSRAELAAALDSISEAVIITDAHGNFVHFNQAYKTLYRFKSTDECSRHFNQQVSLLELFTRNGTPVPSEMWGIPRALRGEKIDNVDFQLRRRDTGEAWTICLSCAPIRSPSGSITGSVVTAREIS